MNKLLIIIFLLLSISTFNALQLPSLAYAQKKKATEKTDKVTDTEAQDKAKLLKDELVKGLKNYNLLRQQEDTLKVLIDSMRNAKDYQKRKEYCYQLIPKFVKTLKIDGAFLYPFDSLSAISKVSPPDESFKIFTWVLPKIESTGSTYTESFRYFGAVLMNNKDSSDFKLYGLVDQSAEIGSPEAEELSHKNWYGALYYNIRQNKAPDGTQYYTLFGWDGYNEISNKKLVDVLHFDKENGNPIFGAPIFDIVREKKQYVGNRMILEFRKGANVGLNFIEEKNIIIYDHLIPEAKADAGNFENYVPDGSYEGLEFREGMWKYVPKIFFETLATAPRPKPVLGNNNKGKKKKKSNKKKKTKSRMKKRK